MKPKNIKPENLKPETLNEKKKQLAKCLKPFGSLLVAFSGGADSSFLLAAAKEALGDNVMAVTMDSAIHPAAEKKEAAEFAKKIGAAHEIISSNEMADPDFIANRADRCYICKKNRFKQIRALADAFNIPHIAHGENMDDLNDFRPGFKASLELNIAAPLIDAGMRKDDIRRLSRQMGLTTWNKPATGCLATRLPCNTPITPAALSMVEQGEAILRAAGFPACRVRHHGQMARIEMAPDEFGKMIEPETAKKTAAAFKKIGYVYISLDLEGYARGRMNRPGPQRP